MNEGINDIQLNPAMLEALYQRSLVPVSNVPAPVKQAAEQPSLKFLGSNAKNITVMVNSPAHAFLPEDQLAFLTKILGACKLNMGDVAIVNTAGGIEVNQITGSLKPSRIISFGVPINTEIETVNAPLLSELVIESAQSKAMKAKLWASLKQMFDV